MNIAKGIKGIRKILAENKVGWHVMVDDLYIGFDESSLKELLNDTKRTWTLTSVMGNNLHFTAKGN